MIFYFLRAEHYVTCEVIIIDRLANLCKRDMSKSRAMSLQNRERVLECPRALRFLECPSDLECLWSALGVPNFLLSAL